MVARGECDALVAERVWKETEKALGTRPSAGLLPRCANAARSPSSFPSSRALWRAAAGALASRDRHRRAHLHGARASRRLSTDPRCASRRSCTTSARARRRRTLAEPSGHEDAQRRADRRHGRAPALSARLPRAGAPRRALSRAVPPLRRAAQRHRARPARGGRRVPAAGAFREQFLRACEADARGRGGFEERPYPQADTLRACAAAAARSTTPTAKACPARRSGSSCARAPARGAQARRLIRRTGQTAGRRLQSGRSRRARARCG